MAAHTVALLAGSAVTASLLLALAHAAGPLPRLAVVAICCVAAAALVAGARLRLPLPGSRWMVPREWSRLGTTGYAAAFGFALGTGWMTMLPSPALYAVLATAEAAPVWWQTFAVLSAFGLARALLVPLLTARSARLGTHPVVGLDALRDRVAGLGWIEAALLAALAMELVH